MGRDWEVKESLKEKEVLGNLEEHEAE